MRRLEENGSMPGRGGRARINNGGAAIVLMLQIVVCLVILGLGGYLLMTDRYAYGGIVIGVGLATLPWAVAGILGGVVCIGAAVAGYFTGRLDMILAILAGCLGLVMIVERMRRFQSGREGIGRGKERRAE